MRVSYVCICLGMSCAADKYNAKYFGQIFLAQSLSHSLLRSRSFFFSLRLSIRLFVNLARYTGFLGEF